jgi:hypothetical protein
VILAVVWLRRNSSFGFSLLCLTVAEGYWLKQASVSPYSGKLHDHGLAPFSVLTLTFASELATNELVVVAALSCYAVDQVAQGVFPHKRRSRQVA